MDYLVVIGALGKLLKNRSIGCAPEESSSKTSTVSGQASAISTPLIDNKKLEQ